MSSTTPSHSESFRGPSYRTQMATVCSSLGISSVVLLNGLRHRPFLFQPWLHVLAGGIGIYAGLKLGSLYDDTNALVNKQSTGYASLPSWAYGQLSTQQLNAELKDKRLVELTRKYEQLAAIEEQTYLEEKANKPKLTPPPRFQ